MSSNVNTTGAVSTLVPGSRPELEAIDVLAVFDVVAVFDVLAAVVALLLAFDVLALLLTGGELLPVATGDEDCWDPVDLCNKIKI